MNHPTTLTKGLENTGLKLKNVFYSTKNAANIDSSGAI